MIGWERIQGGKANPSRTTIEEYADIIRMGGVYVVDGL